MQDVYVAGREVPGDGTVCSTTPENHMELLEASQRHHTIQLPRVSWVLIRIVDFERNRMVMDNQALYFLLPVKNRLKSGNASRARIESKEDAPFFRTSVARRTLFFWFPVGDRDGVWGRDGHADDGQNPGLSQTSDPAAS